VTVTAHTSTYTPVNALSSLQFGTATNGLIDMPGGPTGSTGGFTYPTTGASQTFTIRHAASGATTVPFTIVDSCGSWPTFVGGGASAF
jgi:hypothetical protein